MVGDHNSECFDLKKVTRGIRSASIVLDCWQGRYVLAKSKHSQAIRYFWTEDGRPSESSIQIDLLKSIGFILLPTNRFPQFMRFGD